MTPVVARIFDIFSAWSMMLRTAISMVCFKLISDDCARCN